MAVGKSKSDVAYESYVAMCNRLGQPALPQAQWAGYESGSTCNKAVTPWVEPKNKFAS